MADYQFLGIDHILIAIPPGSVIIARDFYGVILGFNEIQKPIILQHKEGLWYELGKQQLHIGVENNFQPSKRAHPAILVNDLQALRNHLVNHKILITEGESLKDIERFFINDPFGNRIEFMEKTKRR